MKNFILWICVLFFPAILFAQNSPPVAVNDSILEPVHFGDTITINILMNDYDPDGDDFYIFNTGSGTMDIFFESTDSTITFSFHPHFDVEYEGEIEIGYMLMDEYDNIGEESLGKVYFVLINEKTEYLDVNNISARFNAFGNHFWDMESEAHYRYPKDSHTNTLFSFALWIGGMDESNSLRFAGERYRGSGADFTTGPLSFDNDSAWVELPVIAEYLKIWKLNKTEVEHHVLNWQDPNYEPIDNIAHWPAHGNESMGQSTYLAPFIDMNNDGIYEPMSGDYPLIRGDQTLFFVFNDAVPHTESEGEAIGVEIHGFAYSFDAPDDPYLDNATFLSYKIFNRSQHTLQDTYVGLFTDIDLGYAWDDYVGCFVDRGAYFIYNGDSIDGDGSQGSFGDTPPAQGVVVLGGPYLNADGEDNPAGGCDESINGVGFGDGVIDNERFGMSRFIYFNNGGDEYASDPVVAADYYTYLQGIWKDGQAMVYGGNGHPDAGAYGPEAKFMFPDLSDPCNWGTGGIPPNGPIEWTELTAGNDHHDRRGMCSMGPFTLDAGGFHKVDIAFITAQGSDYLESVDVLKTAIDSVKSHYYSDPDHFGYAWLGEEDHQVKSGIQTIILYPNPAVESVGFQYVPDSKEARVLIYNSVGRCVSTELLSPSGKQELKINKLPQGIYIIKLIDENQFSTAKFLKR